MTNDLTHDWPEEPGNEELARFAHELLAARPLLPDDSFLRIEQRLQDALASTQRDRRRLRVAYRCAGLAASLVLVFLSYALFLQWKPGPPAPQPAGPVARNQTPPLPVQDQYQVESRAAWTPVLPEGALVPLEEAKSLYQN